MESLKSKTLLAHEWRALCEMLGLDDRIADSADVLTALFWLKVEARNGRKKVLDKKQ